MIFKGLFFTKSSSFATIATIFSLWLTGYLNPNYEDMLGYALILSVGILHGANDLKLLQVSFKSKSYSFMSMLIRYILVVVIVGVSFFVVPSIALLIFIIFSSYHFGEQHWHHKEKKNSYFNYLLYTSYGFLIFTLLFYLNPVATSDVIYGITGITISETTFEILFYVALILTAISVAIGLLNNSITVKLFEEVFLILVFYILFRTASLIWAFAIYFIFWHSLPSLIDQIKILYGGANKKTVKQYMVSSFIYWLFAIIGLALSIYFFRNNEDYFLPVFFSFLAAITLPHVLVMHKTMHQ